MELENHGPPPPIYLPYLIYIPSNSSCWNLSIDTTPCPQNVGQQIYWYKDHKNIFNFR